MSNVKNTTNKKIKKSKKQNDLDEKNRKTTKVKHVSTEVHDQGNLGICWAHSMATAVRTVQRQLECPEEAITKHSGIVHLLTLPPPLAYGKVGLNTDRHDEVVKTAFTISNKSSMKFGTMKVEKVSSLDEAKDRALKDVVMLVSFQLHEGQWKKMQEFFTKTPKATLEKKDLGKASGELAGHTVTIVGAKISKKKKNDGYWLVKNSWGATFADGGSFRLGFNATVFGYACALKPIPRKMKLKTTQHTALYKALCDQEKADKEKAEANAVKVGKAKKKKKEINSELLKPSSTAPITLKKNKTKKDKKNIDPDDVLKPSKSKNKKPKPKTKTKD